MGPRWLVFAFALGLGGCGAAEPPLARLAKTCASQSQDMSCARPIFNVRELGRSRTYYTETLGFSLDWVDGDPPDFASLSRGDATLFLCEGCQGMPGGWMMAFVPSVDVLFEELRAKHALVRMPPTNMRWGLRELHISDPSGNVIRFGSATPSPAD